MEDRRQHPRIDTDVPVRISFQGVDDFLRAYTENVSLGGIFLPTPTLLDRGTEIDIVVELAPGKGVKARARVEWSRQESAAQKPGLGLRFIDMSPKIRDWLQQVVASKQHAQQESKGSTVDLDDTRSKIVLRYRDGHVLKGYTTDFHPKKQTFHLIAAESNVTAEPIEISIEGLKAVFFVKSFDGNPGMIERKDFLATDKVSGRRIKVTFRDREEIVGVTTAYSRDRPGFFILPVDPQSNNEKVFAVNSAIADVSFI